MPGDSDNGHNSNGNGNGSSSWNMYQRLVVSELDRHDRAINDVKKCHEEDIRNLQDRLTEVRIKEIGEIKNEQTKNNGELKSQIENLKGRIFAGAAIITIVLTIATHFVIYFLGKI